MYSTNDTKLSKSVHVVSFVEIQTKWIEFRPLMGKWSEFRQAQKYQTRVATVPIWPKKFMLHCHMHLHNFKT